MSKDRKKLEAKLTKPMKDDIIIDFFDGRLATGMGRTDAILATCKEFKIKHPQTVYNTEKRVRVKKWEVRHGKREA